MTETLEDELRATLRAVAATYEPDLGKEPRPAPQPARPRLAFLAPAAALVVVVGLGVAFLVRDGDEPGGVDVGGTTVPADVDGWRTGAPAPISTSVLQFSVWTGEEMLVWSSTDGGAGASFDGAAYDPVEDRWRMLDPIDLEDERIRAAIWAGERAVFWVEEESSRRVDPGLADGELRALDPQTTEWVTLVSEPAGERLRFSQLHVIDGVVVVEMITERAQRAILTPDGGYEIVERSYFPTDGSDAAFATLEPTYELITVHPVDLGEELLVGRVDFDTGTARWSVQTAEGDTVSLPANPDDPRWWTQASGLWTGSEVIVWGGFSCDPAEGCAFGQGPVTPFVLVPGEQ